MSFTDINDLQLLSEFEGATDGATPGAEDTFFLPPAPVDDGVHTVTFGVVSNNGITLTRRYNEGDARGNPSGAPYLKFALQLASTEKNDFGRSKFVLFDRVTSIVMPKAGTSKIRAILKKFGCPVPDGITLPGLKSFVETVAASGSATAKVHTRWEASVKGGDGNYHTFLRGQDAFPKDANGKPQHILKVVIGEAVDGQKPSITIVPLDSSEGVEVQAQAVPFKYETA